MRWGPEALKGHRPEGAPRKVLKEAPQPGSSLIADEWIPANTEPVERCGFTVKNLPTGAKITFRVVGVNIAGRSQPATLAQPVTIREIVGEHLLTPRPCAPKDQAGVVTRATRSSPLVSVPPWDVPPHPRLALSPSLGLYPQSNPKSGYPATSARLMSAKSGSISTWSSPSRYVELRVGGVGGWRGAGRRGEKGSAPAGQTQADPRAPPRPSPGRESRGRRWCGPRAGRP